MNASLTNDLRLALSAAFPIMAGYVAIGLPSGLMEQQVGMDALQAFIISIIFYSGAGQFMISGMWLAGQPLAYIIASVSFVNTRQVLYSASLAQYCEKAGKRLSFLFSATVTDESYGVNIAKFASGQWSVRRALLVNCFSMTSWACANAVGAALGSIITIPSAVGAFAMTSIFICLLCSQKFDSTVVVVVFVTVVGVVFCKLVGLTGPAILVGAVLGVVAGMVKVRCV